MWKCQLNCLRHTNMHLTSLNQQNKFLIANLIRRVRHVSNGYRDVSISEMCFNTTTLQRGVSLLHDLIYKVKMRYLPFPKI